MIARQLYRLAVIAFPQRHRRRYRDEMIATFERELALRTSGRSAFVTAACLDALAAGLAERRRDRTWRLGAIFSPLDFILAWRMLLRYPGLSLVSVFGIAVGIAIAAGGFAIMSTMTNPIVPLDEGERVVSLINWDASTSNREQRMVHDFGQWRALPSLVDLSITRTVQRNLRRASRRCVDGSFFLKTKHRAPPRQSSSATTNGCAVSIRIRTSSGARSSSAPRSTPSSA
jgi:hypothetical protein